jgi:hypothetical protein
MGMTDLEKQLTKQTLTANPIKQAKPAHFHGNDKP